MPSAPPDAQARFAADLDALLARSGVSADAPVGIAVSGGPDSMALLLLAAAVRPVRAMTVDHGVRDNSAVEAAMVAAVCAGRGIPHEIARPGRFLCGGNLQAAARAMRYDALGAWVRREGLAAVLTAHHADDQAETILMRLARGSGLAGLASVRAVQHLATEAGDLLVLRPLLGWRKTDFESVCADAGIEPARDSSNLNPRFDRTAARALLARERWLDAGRLAASARHLAEAEETLATIADERYEAVFEDGDWRLRPDPHREIARRHLRRLLSEQFNAHPDGPSLEGTLRSLENSIGTTCAGILCHADPPYWRFRRAPPRRPG